MRSCFLLLICCSVSQAGIVIVVDDITQEFWFAGTDMGTMPQVAPSTFAAIWSEPTFLPGENIVDSFQVNIGAALTVPGGVSTNTFSYFGGDQGNEGFDLQTLHIAASSPTTILADSAVKISYAGADVMFQDELESLAQNSGAIPAFNGFSPIQVQQVPEPSSFLFLMLVWLFVAGRHGFKRSFATDQ